MGLGHVMRHALIRTAAVAALAMLASHADNAIAAPHRDKPVGRVEVTGKLHAPNVSTSGHDVPLREALERIVPADYSINLPNAGPWAEAPVSWQGGRSFVEALREALASLPEVSAKIDAGLQMITVRSRALPFGAAAAPPQQAGMKPMLDAGSHAPPLIAAAQGQSPPMPAPAPQYPAAAPPDAASAQKTANASAIAARGDARPDGKTLSSLSAPPAMNVGGGPSSIQTSVQAAAIPAPAQAAKTAATSSPPAAVDTFPVPPPEVSRSWRLELADRTVKTALTRWAKEAGWQLVWEVPVDFGIDADATITGTFDDALHAVVHALDKSDTPIQAILYKGNKVLRIVAHGAAS